ncbi:hypothetical protein JYG23_09030 [Sedimentibacter sp. zth1]|uniref:hypothetical protein n=1 Tax=Sedimentibacter sp. zth1 TaxID=2816908 RepID=UPI001A910AEC|nr:hypothetical protein [Sedimentibacter sp. zth1]QSX04846.1 hypothetical protein JYG23_09030 [Sedimentibacter sp. zth1]
MRKLINEKIVMEYYLQKIKCDDIEFLKNRTEDKNIISKLIINLIDSVNMNEKIQVASKLWKKLFESAMSFIDSNKDGYDDLFKYFDEFVEFEELIFASDSFYRDHTLHCLWVYFLGEYIYSNDEFIKLKLESQDDNKDIYGVKQMLQNLNILDYFPDITRICNTVEAQKKLADSVRCIAAITHDLGYPIKKINKINNSMKKILPYYGINSYSMFNFRFDNIQQQFINSFVDILATKIEIEFNVDETLIEYFDIKCKEDSTKHINFNIEKFKVENFTDVEIEEIRKSIKTKLIMVKCIPRVLKCSKNFEEYNHGIMSAFLLARNLSAFKSDDFNYNSNTENIKCNLAVLDSKNEILKSIYNHTSETFKIKTLDKQSYLTFIDELEEFSRISRASQNREYVEEFCQSYIYMEDGWLNIDFEFTNNDLDNLDPEIAFKGRCRRFLTLFDIANLDNSLKIRLRCIGKLNVDENVYTIEIANRYADILINGISQNIPKYLKSNQFYTKEEYSLLRQ